MTTYVDFELELGPAPGGTSLEVRSFDRPQLHETTGLPMSDLEEHGLLERMEKCYERGEATGASFGDLGRKLFSSLFPREVEERFRKKAEAGEAGALRLRLAFEDEAARKGRPPGADLPWEGLVDPDSGKYFFEEKRPIVRYLDLPIASRRFEVPRPVRVLLVAPDPNMAKNGEAGDSLIAEGRKDLEAFFASADAFQAEVVSPPTWERFQEKLRRGDFHILHFLGHGGFHDEAGIGGIFFEQATPGPAGPAGQRVAAEQVLGTDFAKALRGQRNLRLVVLNSCRTAWSSGKEGQDPLRGVASALLAHEVPAVVGMRFNFRQDAALLFSQAFYQHLAETGQVDGATCAGRRALFEHDATWEQWLIPTLYSRAAHGQIFDTSPPEEGERLHRIGIRSFFGWGTEIEEWSDFFLPLTCFFRGRYLKEAVHWPEIHKRLRDFLGRASEGRGHLHLDFAAHCSLAFATGRFLEAKSEHSFTIRQRGRGTEGDWRIEEPRPGDDFPGFAIREHEGPGEGADLAFVVSATRPALADAEFYLRRHSLPVEKVLEFVPPDGSSQVSIRGGRHAFQLAEQVCRFLGQKAAAADGVIHLFLAVPNGLAFTLGCFSRGARTLQLYEYDFDGQGNKSYMPSLRFPILGG